MDDQRDMWKSKATGRTGQPTRRGVRAEKDILTEFQSHFGLFGSYARVVLLQLSWTAEKLVEQSIGVPNHRMSGRYTSLSPSKSEQDLTRSQTFSYLTRFIVLLSKLI